jgi:enoyl-CoA hydratase/carnithine racemase
MTSGVPSLNVSVSRTELTLGEGMKEASYATVTLNRPDSMNALDRPTMRELARIFDELAQDDSVRVVAVTGAGTAFSAGGDVTKTLQLLDEGDEFARYLEEAQQLFAAIPMYPKPYIALVNGTAAAGGLELILACDFAIAAEDARIGDAHLRFGQMGGGGSLVLLPRAVGPARARELIFSGRLLDAHEALAWGLVSQVVALDELDAAAMRFATRVAHMPPVAVRHAKQVINTALWEGTGVVSGLRQERLVSAIYALTSQDCREGIAAFIEKRAPRYTGK